MKDWVWWKEKGEMKVFMYENSGEKKSEDQLANSLDFRLGDMCRSKDNDLKSVE